MEEYFGKTLVGQKQGKAVRTYGDYAREFVEHDIEGFNIFLKPEWSKDFRDGVAYAHFDFLTAIRQYVVDYQVDQGWLTVHP